MGQKEDWLFFGGPNHSYTECGERQEFVVGYSCASNEQLKQFDKNLFTIFDQLVHINKQWAL